METIRIIIQGRIYEVPIIYKFTIDAVVSNMTDLSGLKPSKYTPAFIAELEAGLLVVSEIVNPAVLTAELKLVTFNLYVNVIGLRQTMNLLEAYVSEASGLTVAAKDFGMKEVRDKVSSMDVEGLDGTLSTVLTNINNNMTALEAVDYTAAMKTALVNTKKAIFDGNALQNKKMEERADLVKNNIDKINGYLKVVKGIWTDGKSLYRMTDRVKLKFFTNADIIRRIRNDELHTLIAGTVTNSKGEPVGKVRVMARPSTEGKRGKTAKTNAQGYYELKGLQPKNYIITLTMPSDKMYVLNADAKTNETVVVDFKEPE